MTLLRHRVPPCRDDQASPGPLEVTQSSRAATRRRRVGLRVVVVAPLLALTGLAAAAAPSTAFAATAHAAGHNHRVDARLSAPGPHSGSTAAGGLTWASPVMASPKIGGLSAISCPSASFCAAVDNSGYVVTYNGTSWSAPTSIDPNGFGLSSVSCPSASFCAAVDSAGNALTYNGTSWSAPTSIDPNGLTSVSCFSASFCAAVDYSGNVVTYNGTSWSAPASIDPNDGGLTSVSCPSASFCVAGDYLGQVVVGTESTGPSVTSVSPTSGPTAGGTVVTIDGTNLSGATAVDFGSNPATKVSCTSTSCSATSPAGSGTVDVTVTTPGGTSATSSADKFAYLVPRPVVSKLLPGKGPTAGGTVVTITGKNLAGAIVHFGTKLAKIDTRISATEIKVTAPSGSGTVYVTVTTAGGTSAKTTADRFSYI